MGFKSGGGEDTPRIVPGTWRCDVLASLDSCTKTGGEVEKKTKTIFFQIWLGMVPRSSELHSEHPPMPKIKPNMSKTPQIAKTIINFEKKL